MIGGLFFILLTLLDMTYSWIYYVLYTTNAFLQSLLSDQKYQLEFTKCTRIQIGCLFGSWLYGTIDQKNMKNLIGRKECNVKDTLVSEDKFIIITTVVDTLLLEFFITCWCENVEVAEGRYEMSKLLLHCSFS